MTEGLAFSSPRRETYGNFNSKTDQSKQNPDGYRQMAQNELKFLFTLSSKSESVLRLVVSQTSKSASARQMIEGVLSQGSSVMMAQVVFPLIHRLTAAKEDETGCSIATGKINTV